MRKCLLIILTFIAVSSCSKFVEFKDFYVAFEPSNSSSTSINSKGNLTGEYIVHLCSTMPSEPIDVVVSVNPGSGLTEGVDYNIESLTAYNKSTGSGTLKFLPGVFNQKIKIRWISHELDSAKDNTLTLRIESASSDISLGVPGPDKKNRELKITKF